MPLRVLIVGASVAGPMTAYWLARTGADITIIERFPALRTGGQNVDIRTCGVTVIRKMSKLEATLRNHLAPLQGMQLVDTGGTPLITIRGTGDAEQQSLISEYEVFRDDLARIIYDLNVDNPRIRHVFGEQIASLRQEKDSVTVAFANGHLPETRYDLVVAADGATSRTRALGFDCCYRDHIIPLNAWAAYCTVPRDFLEGSKISEFSTSTPGRAMILAPDHQAGHNRAVLSGAYPRSAPTEQVMRPFQEAVKAGDDSTKAYLSNFFQGHKPDDILQVILSSDNLYASEAVQVKVPQLYKGRFVLVGDAGYAAGPTGTGTSLAITGAYLLAGEINNHPEDLALGLQRYAERMQPIVADMQQIPPGFPGIMTPQSAWGLSLRNAVIRTISVLMATCAYTRIDVLFSWVAARFSSSFGKDKYNVPEYEWKF